MEKTRNVFDYASFIKLSDEDQELATNGDLTPTTISDEETPLELEAPVETETPDEETPDEETPVELDLENEEAPLELDDAVETETEEAPVELDLETEEAPAE